MRSGLVCLLAAGLLFVASPGLTREDDEITLVDPAPELAGLARSMWDYAWLGQPLSPEELPRVKYLKDVERHYYGYYLNEADGFFYGAYWDGPCGCGEYYKVGAFKKSDGGYLLVKSGDAETCHNNAVAEATAPWAQILPPAFSLQNFYQAGEKLRTDRTVFLVEVDIPEKGLDLILTIQPILNLNLPYSPDKIFGPLGDWDYFNPGGKIIDTYITFLQGGFAEVVSEGRLAEEYRDRIDFTPEDLRGLAVNLLRDSSAVWEKGDGEFTRFITKERGVEASSEQTAELAAQLAVHYENYREYLKLGIKSFVLEWSRADNRFHVKDKIPLVSGPSFIDFLITDSYVFRTGC